MTDTIRWERGDDGIVVLTLDDPNRSANTMNSDYVASMARTLDRLDAEKDDIAGVIVTSAKETFFVGGDLNDLFAVTPETGAQLAEEVRMTKGQLRRLETLGRPVVAAINGTALGGGLEICLATHHRIVVDDPRIQLGLPEATLGLLPGAGGVTRTVRMLGVVGALSNVLLRGQRLVPQKAAEVGIVDELVGSRDDLVRVAKAWIAEHPDAHQPWDVEGYDIPGGTPSDPVFAATLATLPANLRKRLKGANFPAPHHIMAAAVEGAQVDFDNALEIEGRYFVDLATGQVATNMIKAFFFDLKQVSGSRGRPAGLERFTATKAVVLGAGMMGAAIAYVCAKAGVDVVLKDVSQEAADRGKAYSTKLVEKAVERGAATRAEGDALLDRIVATTDPAVAGGADLLIEAVFEDPAIKAQVYAEIEPYLSPNALLGSNTSTLPITGLAECVTRPADFIGLHFFSPVDKMPLLEIVRGVATTDETVCRALDVAKQIRKTPIVVNDSRGFFTSRVIGTFMNEGIAMLGEGVAPASIEQATSQAGYPAPVLQLSDELNLRLMLKIRDAYRDAGGDWRPHPAEAIIETMVVEHSRPGRLGGAGFYEYADGKRIGLWSGLSEAFPVSEAQLPFEDLKERMMFVEAIESVKCLDEGVIETVADANIGSILGIGFPGWTGGVLQYISGYEGGLPGFVARARQLAARYGERFEPPASLVEKAKRNELYVDSPATVSA
jgi:3-hydroxyacyl-CoA dehydrogenase / enoyl-CoA hydratase / 3-hydroxybutyryl-CoA epimerase